MHGGAAGERLLDRAYAYLSGDDASERSCAAIPEAACTAVPRNYLLNLANGACTKLAEQIASPGLVLPWILSALGAPPAVAGYLLPIRQAGALLPQMATAAAIRAVARRKWVWAAAGAVQALALAAMIPAALYLSPAAAGLVFLLAMAVFAVASGAGSVAFQGVTAKTVPKGRRGRMLAARAALGGLLTLLASGWLRFGMEGAAGLAVSLALVGVAASLWAAAALCFALIEETPGASEGGRNTLPAALAGFRRLGRVPAFRQFLLVRALLLSVELAAPFFVLHAQARYGQGIGTLALFVFAAGLGAVGSSPFWGRLADRSSGGVLALSGALAAAAGVFALLLPLLPGLAGQGWAYAPVFALLGLAEQGVRLGRKTYLVDAAPDDERPLYVGSANSAIGLLALGVGALGFAVSWLGPAAVLSVLAALALFGALAASRLPPPEAFRRQAGG